LSAGFSALTAGLVSYFAFEDGCSAFLEASSVLGGGLATAACCF